MTESSSNYSVRIGDDYVLSTRKTEQAQEKFQHPVLGIKKNDDRAKRPVYQYPEDSGMDVYALEEFVLNPGEHRLIRTGLCLQIPIGYEIQLRSRSGLALRNQVVVLNSPGTIDQTYVGEIGVILKNHGTEWYQNDGSQAIAQLVLSRISQAKIVEIEELLATNRGVRGYGSTDRLDRG